MNFMVFSGNKQSCIEKAKELAKSGEPVRVVWNDFYFHWQVDIFEPDENGILFVDDDSISYPYGPNYGDF